MSPAEVVRAMPALRKEVTDRHSRLNPVRKSPTVKQETENTNRIEPRMTAACRRQFLILRGVYSLNNQ